MPTTQPRVSIITPSLNMARFLSATIESVLNQDYPCIDYLVMDAGSTDGTPALLNEYSGRLRFRIAPDKGPADAIARGFDEADGEFLAWLNADDLYEPGAISAAVAYLVAHPEADVVYGDACWIDEAGAPIRPYPTIPFDARALARDCFICQPATLIRASAYRRCPLDPSVSISFDYDLWIRMARGGARFAHIPVHLANSRMHKSTLSFRDRDRVFQDSIRLLQRHYGYVPFSWVFGYSAFCADGRDQFFEPLQPTAGTYLRALPLGFRYNPDGKLRFFSEWLSMPFAAVRRRLVRYAQKAGDRT